MSIALVISDVQDAIALLPWGIAFAKSRDDSLLLCFLNTSTNGQREEREEIDLSGDVDSEGPNESLQPILTRLRELGCVHQANPDEELGEDKTGVRFLRWSTATPGPTLRQEISKSKIEAIMLRRGDKSGVQSLDMEIVQAIVSDVPCEVIQVSPGVKPIEELRSIMVPVSPGAPSAAALRFGQSLTTSGQAKLTGVYVEPNVDEYADQVGSKILERLLRATLGKEAENVEQRVVLEDNVQRGIRSVIDDYDVVILGTRHHGRMHRWLIRGISEELLTLPDGPNVISMRSSTPLSGRIASAIDRSLRHGIPQLERAQRIQVVERIQSSSKWDFDFIALICLSTMIATGGLIQNSAAVVIGAMLVAPLMTPLLGAGLSLVQGNLVLLRTTMQSVIRGFILAVAIAGIIGFMTPDLQITSEMEARGAPRVLDLLVAFISGMAAAYAIGRPNLLSALPGVAIAAALVPPLATLGLGLAVGEWRLSMGAALLFVTNIVSIVLGTAFSFLAVGIRGSHTHGAFQSRSLRIAMVLVVLFVALGIYESLPQAVVPATFRQQLESYIVSQDEVKLLSITRGETREPNTVDIVLQSPTPVPAEIGIFIRSLAESEFQTPIRVRVTNELVTLIDTDSTD